MRWAGLTGRALPRRPALPRPVALASGATPCVLPSKTRAAFLGDGARDPISFRPLGSSDAESPRKGFLRVEIAYCAFYPELHARASASGRSQQRRGRGRGSGTSARGPATGGRTGAEWCRECEGERVAQVEREGGKAALVSSRLVSSRLVSSGSWWGVCGGARWRRRRRWRHGPWRHAGGEGRAGAGVRSGGPPRGRGALASASAPVRGSAGREARGAFAGRPAATATAALRLATRVRALGVLGPKPR